MSPAYDPFLSGAREDVGVNVDEPRCHVEAGDVHHFEGFRGIESRFDGGNLSRSNRDVTNCAHAVPRIDHVPATEEEVVFRLGAGNSGKRGNDED